MFVQMVFAISISVLFNSVLGSDIIRSTTISGRRIAVLTNSAVHQNFMLFKLRNIIIMATNKNRKVQPV